MVKHEVSTAYYARARQLMPGGVSSPVRAFRGVGGDPLFIMRGEGPYLYDVDGNRYVDYVLSWGPLILGHAHPAVVEAVQGQVTRGTSFGARLSLRSRWRRWWSIWCPRSDGALRQFRHEATIVPRCGWRGLYRAR